MFDLADYRELINADIAAYAKDMRRSAGLQFGQVVQEVEVDVFLDVLGRGGKRLRGALVMAGYEMCGGKDTRMIVVAARAMEMLHAYLLIIDDIQDRSELRRGKPTAHKILQAYHEQHKLKGDSVHAGESLAQDAALAGAHAALMLLANLDADAEWRLKVCSIVNRTLAITHHGQVMDLMNSYVDTPSAKDIQTVMEWKTALYSIINPLQVGMVLTGAECATTTAVTSYGINAGKAFQIVDDILGIVGTQEELGKMPGDDLREGKGTLLVSYALQHAAPEDKKFLLGCMGDGSLSQQNFEQCRNIFERCGAVSYAHKQADDYVKKALAALDDLQGLVTDSGIEFLRKCAIKLQHRVC